MDSSTPGFLVLRNLAQSLLKFMSFESVMPSNHLCCPILLLSSIFPSIRVFSNESALHIRWLKYWSFSFSISPWSPCHPRDSQESSPACCWKASILRHSAFFMVQLSHPHMTTGKTIALTRWTFVGKVMSLLRGCSRVGPTPEGAPWLPPASSHDEWTDSESWALGVPVYLEELPAPWGLQRTQHLW